MFLLHMEIMLGMKIPNFGWKNSEIKRAAIVQAVVISSSVLQDWNGLGRGRYSNWTQTNGGEPQCGHYSSYPLRHY